MRGMAGKVGSATLGDIDRDSLFLALRPDLLRYGRAIAADVADVEDIIQETWLRFNRAGPTQRSAEPRGFLFRIVRNLVMDGYRRRRIEQRLFASDGGDAAASVPSDEPSAHARVEATSELFAIGAAIERLPRRTREAFLMHRVHGMKLVDIAERLEISKSLAQQLVVEGLERCREARRRAG